MCAATAKRFMPRINCADILTPHNTERVNGVILFRFYLFISFCSVYVICYVMFVYLLCYDERDRKIQLLSA